MNDIVLCLERPLAKLGLGVSEPQATTVSNDGAHLMPSSRRRTRKAVAAVFEGAYAPVH